MVEKEKFFLNKTKIVYLRENNEHREEKEHGDTASEYLAMRSREIEYWDFDISSGDKSERKVIPLASVKQCQFKDSKLLSIVHQNDK